jgi:hypothetical protein
MQWLVLKQYAWPSEMVPHIIGEACQLPLSPTTVQIPNIQREKGKKIFHLGSFLPTKRSYQQIESVQIHVNLRMVLMYPS